MPFPPNLEGLEKSGYHFIRMSVCEECGSSMEVFTTPGKREMAFDPMILLTTPAAPHYQTCDPTKPQIRRVLEKTWKFEERVQCSGCKMAIEKWSSNGETVSYEPMMEELWPVILHVCKSVQSRTRRNEPPQEPRTAKPSPETQQEAVGANAGQQQGIDAIRLRGVTDPNFNIIAVGYEPEGGILVCQWKDSKGFHTQVPEDVYRKLLTARFAYRQYTLTVKGKFPYQKVN